MTTYNSKENIDEKFNEYLQKLGETLASIKSDGKLRTAELKIIAREKGIAGYSDMNRQELLEALVCYYYHEDLMKEV